MKQKSPADTDYLPALHVCDGGMPGGSWQTYCLQYGIPMDGSAAEETGEEALQHGQE